MIPISLSVYFIVLTVLSMSFTTLIIKKGILKSGLDDNDKLDYSRRAGLFARGWILLIAIMGLGDVFRDFNSTPPKIFLALLPPFATLVWLVRSNFIKNLIPHLSIFSVYCMQVFRVAVELCLLQLWKAQLIPQSMTFEGRNFDILIGATAPVIGWLIYRAKALPETVALYWNFLGLIVLTNVVVTGILSVPTPFQILHEDYPNTAVGYFPFVWLPTVLVPLAYALHIIAIRYYFRSAKSSE